MDDVDELGLVERMGSICYKSGPREMPRVALNRPFVRLTEQDQQGERSLPS